MIARILSIYDMRSVGPQIQNVLGGALLGSMVSECGLWIVAQLFKFIPGLGSIAEGS